jgi:predicted glycoside hydrolase/deacetylase ChbG (UPF0249 family)
MGIGKLTTMEKYCIVNGDDFGASTGTNRGIVEAHRNGILTSTSLMVDMPGAEEAAQLSRDFPQISIGIHVMLTSEDCVPLLDFTSAEQCCGELDRQWDKFITLMGRAPTHIDAHHNIHRDPLLEPQFIAWATRHNLPLREHSTVKYFSSFYGQWDGETHPEQISVTSICNMLATEIGEGFTELSCHPGYVDPAFPTEYSVERELELETLCDPQVRDAMDALGISLISYQDLSRLLPASLSRSA